MSRTQYPIHPDFKGWARVNPPIVKPLLPMMQRSLRLLYALERSDKAMTVTKKTIPTEDGQALRALWYEPKRLGENAPCLIVYHGGGFVFPAAPYHFALAKEYALRAGCKALFVDYRLAPKHPFPAAPMDCFAAYRWVLRSAEALSIDTGRIAVTGDSAGGELAAVVCLMAREQQLPMPRAQMLIYPVVGAPRDTPSMLEFTDTPLCNSKDMDQYGRLYQPKPNMGKPEYASPYLAESLAGQPEAYIETAEFDCLRDGGALYAKRLEQSGVPAELNSTKGTMHGFDIVLKSPIVRACVDRRVAFLRRVFGLGTEKDKGSTN